MKFTEKWPHAVPGEEPQEAQNLGLIMAPTPLPCCKCKQETPWIEISFEANLCSEECMAELNKEFMDAYNAVPTDKIVEHAGEKSDAYETVLKEKYELAKSKVTEVQRLFNLWGIPKTEEFTLAVLYFTCKNLVDLEVDTTLAERMMRSAVEDWQKEFPKGN